MAENASDATAPAFEYASLVCFWVLMDVVIKTISAMTKSGAAMIGEVLDEAWICTPRSFPGSTLLTQGDNDKSEFPRGLLVKKGWW
jgi:hypothetical protein